MVAYQIHLSSNEGKDKAAVPYHSSSPCLQNQWTWQNADIKRKDMLSGEQKWWWRMDILNRAYTAIPKTDEPTTRKMLIMVYWIWRKSQTY